MPANFSITPLPLVEPVERGSRGRNRHFTAVSLQVQVHLPAGPGEGPSYCAISAYSRRAGRDAPATITLSLGDAVELAGLIIREVEYVLHPKCPACETLLSYETTDANDRPTYCSSCDREVSREEVADAPTAP